MKNVTVSVDEAHCLTRIRSSRCRSAGACCCVKNLELSYWDGAILAAARAAGCDAVYSKDLSSEQDYDGLAGDPHPVVAVSISRRFELSYWDGAILAAARAAGCDAVYSEDLSSEQDDGLRVINPFAGR